jgi:hypothetical protein
MSFCLYAYTAGHGDRIIAIDTSICGARLQKNKKVSLRPNKSLWRVWMPNSQWQSHLDFFIYVWLFVLFKILVKICKIISCV